jgi:outer membrane protein OmpA-like peptidoglycan-associated protein
MVQPFQRFYLPVLVSTLLLGAVVSSTAEECEKAKRVFDLGEKLLSFEERRVAFQRALDLCPTYPEAYYGLATSLEGLAVVGSDNLTKGEADQASSNDKQLKKVTDLFDKAKEAYRKAIQYRDGYVEAHLALAQLYAAEGLYEEAAEEFKKAQKPGPFEKKALDGLEAVQQLIASTKACPNKKKTAKEILAQVKDNQMRTMAPEKFIVLKDRQTFTNIIFDGWSPRISRKEALDQLDEIGKALSHRDLSGYKFIVEGHANTVGLELENGFQKLLKLSDDRAAEVKKYLEKKFKISADRIYTQGFGCKRLRFPDDTTEHRTLNRRVEVVFLRKSND